MNSSCALPIRIALVVPKLVSVSKKLIFSSYTSDHAELFEWLRTPFKFQIWLVKSGIAIRHLPS